MISLILYNTSEIADEVDHREVDDDVEVANDVGENQKWLDELRMRMEIKMKKSRFLIC